MGKSRRNYYRILHVQPEAPVEVIKAAYRAMMQTLRMHPDLGGDHEQAAIINEAYAVLIDRDKRAAYDQGILPVIRRARVVAGASAAYGLRPEAAVSANACSFCGEPLPARIHTDTRCGRCTSPLSAPPNMFLGRELAGRRSATRASKNHTVNVQLVWRGTVCRATLRDLSLTGMSLVAPVALATHQVIRVLDPDFEALAVVVKSRHERSQYVLHTKLATLLAKRAFGVFVKTAA